MELITRWNALSGSIAGTFDHILVVGEIFHAHLESRDHRYRVRHRAGPLAFLKVAQRLRDMDDHYVDLARWWSDAELAETILFTFVCGSAGVMAHENILQHLVNHATYHHGFVSTLLYPHKTKGAGYAIVGDRHL